LYNEIIKITSDLEKTYVINKKLRARVIFLLKYSCDLNKLKNGEKWLSFCREKDDFIKKSINSAKNGWDKKFNLVDNLNPLTKDETINEIKKLKSDEIFGKSKNRVLMSNNPILFKSVEFYSAPLSKLNKISNKFPSKILFLREFGGDMEKLKCSICNINSCLYNEQKKEFNQVCKKCYHSKSPKYPQKTWFKKTFGDEWEKHYIDDRNKIKSYRVNSESWFMKKYGSEIGEQKRIEYLNERIKNIINLKNKRVSKISQILFWRIYEKLSDKNNCYFHELNKEIMLRSNGFIFFPDFVYNSKIIEYDGIYWHNEKKDKNRNFFYEKMGYDVLIVNSNEFNRGRIDNEIIYKCLTFLNNEA
jgi:hypothetical protein